MPSCFARIQVVEQSCTGNMAELVGSQDGAVLVKQYDWSTFFLSGTKIQGIKERQQFSFHQSSSGEFALSLYLLIFLDKNTKV